MNENRRIVAITSGLLLLLGAAAWYGLGRDRQPPPEAPQMPVTSTAGPASAAPVGEPMPDHHEMPPTVASATPLPALGESDAPFRLALGGLADATDLASALVAEHLIRRLVVTVDNLPRAQLAMNDRAFKRVPGEFVVKSRDGLYTSSPANEARYLPLIGLMTTVGASRAAALYLQFYPLFDQAYRELGFSDRHFNDRLVQVIDHLLATPLVEGPIELVRPKVVYQFADPELESRSTGQKMLIRAGSVNAAQLKAWLKAFRAEIVA